ncbi:MAG TPA: thiol reductant ABC exporter subunit CydD [Anaerolineaceae bacterium]|nr:thiol reductant ABC exporter subunit CydD [Anaerolineaceae bacterium]
MNLDPRLLRQVRLAHWNLLLTVAAGFAGGLLVIGQAGLLSRLIDAVFLHSAVLESVLPFFGGLLAVFVLRPALAFAADLFAARLAGQVKESLRAALVRQVIARGPASAGTAETGSLSATALQGIEALDAYFAQYLPQLALGALLPLAVLVVVFPLDWLSAVVLLLTGPLVPLFMILIGKAAEKGTRRQWGLLRQMSAFFLDTIQGLTALKLLGRLDRLDQIEAVSERYHRMTMSVLRVTFLSAFALELVATISTALVAVEIGLRLLRGGIGFEQAFFILVLAPEFYQPLRQLGLRFHAGMNGVTAARTIFAVLEAPVPPVTAPESAPRIDLDAALRSPFRIRFDGVSYRYTDRDGPALNQVSFELGSGEQVALVGPSGAGKSTAARLLLRFMEPDSGQILLNGQPITRVSPEAWRRQIAYVPQQPAIFHDTIAANIRLARPDAPLPAVREAARLAELDELIASLPEGYETVIGAGGARLSGGQAQRIALARAFLRDASILVFDEPTAHLDLDHEARLEAATRRLLQGRAVLTIAHRLPTVLAADRIVVFSGGQVVEAGPHAALLAQSGLYTRLLASYGGAA